ncbi:MAG: 23S rRNA (uracil(1939)-C(5))-methyltransferase RlmD [Phycisphaerae bacterium]|jgi:23S rRNA (uracil-5-)-methyltransferase RumA
MESVLSCPHFPACSGCKSIGVPYAEQLEAKLRAVRALFEVSKLGTLSPASIERITSSPKPYGYRNRVRLVPKRQGAHVALGLYQAGSHRVVDVPGCPVQSDGINTCVEAVRSAIEAFSVNLYDEREHTGDLRYVSIREAAATRELLVGLVTAAEPFAPGRAVARYLADQCQNVVGVVQNINPKKGNVIFGPTTRPLCGREYIEDQVCDVRVRLDLTSFFQANTAVAEKVYEAIARHVTPTSRSSADHKTQTVMLDLYAGVGTIALIASAVVDRVIAVEEFEGAVALARTAAAVNNRHNIEFRCGLAEDLLPQIAGELRRRRGDADVVAAVNPPRKGLDASAVTGLINLAPARVAYLSCAPRTLIRDLVAFERGGYRIERLELFDMFPQTDQVETLVLLERRA